MVVVLQTWPPCALSRRCWSLIISQQLCSVVLQVLKYVLPPILLPVLIADQLKGLLLLHPDEARNMLSVPEIYLRDSQRKIVYPELHDPAHLTIDVLRTSHITTPARLSYETIINLAENGVPPTVFYELLQLGVDEVLDCLFSWPEDPLPLDATSHGSMRTLHRSVNRAGAVTGAKLARLNIACARAKGYIWDHKQEEGDDDTEPLVDDLPRSTAWWPDYTSGQPSSLEETVLVLIEAGFHPLTEWILQEKLRQVINTALNRFSARKPKIPVSESCSAFVVPGEFYQAQVLWVTLTKHFRPTWYLEGRRNSSQILSPFSISNWRGESSHSGRSAGDKASL